MKVTSKADFWIFWKQDSRKFWFWIHRVSVCNRIPRQQCLLACFEKMKSFPSFAVSTLVPSSLEEEHSPRLNTLYSPLWRCLNPTGHPPQVVGHHFSVVRWVESWGWYNARWKWPSFGCLNLFFSYVCNSEVFLLMQFNSIEPGEYLLTLHTWMKWMEYIYKIRGI